MTIEECVYWLGIARHPLACDGLSVVRARVWAQVEWGCARTARAEGFESDVRLHVFCAWLCRQLVHLLATEEMRAA